MEIYESYFLELLLNIFIYAGATIVALLIITIAILTIIILMIVLERLAFKILFKDEK